MITPNKNALSWFAVTAIALFICWRTGEFMFALLATFNAFLAGVCSVPATPDEIKRNGGR